MFSVVLRWSPMVLWGLRYLLIWEISVMCLRLVIITYLLRPDPLANAALDYQIHSRLSSSTYIFPDKCSYVSCLLFSGCLRLHLSVVEHKITAWEHYNSPIHLCLTLWGCLFAKEWENNTTEDTAIIQKTCSRTAVPRADLNFTGKVKVSVNILLRTGLFCFTLQMCIHWWLSQNHSCTFIPQRRANWA